MVGVAGIVARPTPTEKGWTGTSGPGRYPASGGPSGAFALDAGAGTGALDAAGAGALAAGRAATDELAAATGVAAFGAGVAGDAHPVYRKGGIVAREHDEAQAPREIGQQVVQRAIELRGPGRLVVVVEDDVDVSVDPALALRDEQRPHVLDGEGGLGGGPQAFADRLAELGKAFPEGHGERRKEDDGVAVEDVQLADGADILFPFKP